MFTRTNQFRMGGLLILALAVLGGIWAVSAGADAGAPDRPAVPAGAEEIAPDVFALGTRLVDGVHVEGFAIVRRALPAKPDNPGGGGGGNGGGKGGGGGGGDATPTCFSYLADGLAWTSTTDFIVDDASGPSLGDVTAPDLATGVQYGIGEWNAVTAMDPFGAQSVGTVDIASLGNTTNGANEIAYRSISDAGVIAVTYVWGVFIGPPSGRGLVEWDMILDDDGEWDWRVDATGAAYAPNDGVYVIDLDSILVHELGHALGLGHAPDECDQETMYRYYGEAQTDQRTIEAGDTAGAQSLYG